MADQTEATSEGVDQGTPEKIRPEGRFHWCRVLLFTAGILGWAQGFFLLLRYQEMPNTDAMALRFLGLGTVVAIMTMLVATPLIIALAMIARRRLRGDPVRRDPVWHAAFAFVVFLVTWMVSSPVLSGGLLATAVVPIVVTVVALLAGLIAAKTPAPSPRWIRLGAWLPLPGLIALFLAGAGETSSPPPEPGQGNAEGPDVVLITIDTLRADRLGAYGRTPSLTPSLDQLAGEGVLFRHVVASSPWTLPSLASVMTGKPTLGHRAGLVLGSGPAFRRTPLAEEASTLAERFHAIGYETRAVVANAFLSPDTGMAQGFEVFENPLLQGVFAGMLLEMPLPRWLLHFIPPAALGDPRAEGLTDTAIEWLALPRERPLFLWVHYIDPHAPFRAEPSKLEVTSILEEMDTSVPMPDEDGSVVGGSFSKVHAVRSGFLWLDEQDRQEVVALYDRGVTYVDGEVGRLLEAIRGQGDGETLVCFTADHGEEFWDHGGFEHGHDYYQEVVRVPLVFWQPGVLPSGLEVTQTVGLVDVAPTVLDLAGIRPWPARNPDEGISLVGSWQAEGFEVPPRFSGGNLYDLPAALVAEGPWRFILRSNQQEELYDISRDPGEMSNRVVEHPEVAERLRQLLEPRLQVLAAGSEMDLDDLPPEVLEGLKSLGYVN